MVHIPFVQESLGSSKSRMTKSPAKTTLIYVMESTELQDREARSGPKNMPSALPEEMAKGSGEKRVCDVTLAHDGFTANFRTKIAKENRNIGSKRNHKPDQVDFQPSENSSSNIEDEDDLDDACFRSCMCCWMKMVPRRGKHKATVSYVKTDDSLRTVGLSTGAETQAQLNSKE